MVRLTLRNAHTAAEKRTRTCRHCGVRMHPSNRSRHRHLVSTNVVFTANVNVPLYYRPVNRSSSIDLDILSDFRPGEFEGLSDDDEDSEESFTDSEEEPQPPVDGSNGSQHENGLADEPDFDHDQPPSQASPMQEDEPQQNSDNPGGSDSQHMSVSQPEQQSPPLPPSSPPPFLSSSPAIPSSSPEHPLLPYASSSTAPPQATPSSSTSPPSPFLSDSSIWSDQRDEFEALSPRTYYLTHLPGMDDDPEATQELNRGRMRLEVGMDEDSDEFKYLKMYKLQLEIGLGTNAYAKLIHTFPDLSVPSLKVLRRHVRQESGLAAVAYDCCKNSCLCYTGGFSNLTSCPYCKHPRRDDRDRPYNQFNYVPLTPQLRALYAGKHSANAMRYRSRNHNDYVTDPHGRVTDLYDSELYRHLRDSLIEIDGRQIPFKYFSDPRDILLVGMTDGFALWKRSQSTAWPLIFINANLAPEDRFKLSNILCVGVIPGPRKPKHFDSFTFLVVEELSILARGIAVFDALDMEIFTLRVFSPYKTGDMPAATQAWLRCKGPNGKKPCWFCNIEAIPIRGSRSHTHYVPIRRPPSYPPNDFGPEDLPLRTNTQWRSMARRVDRAVTGNQQKHLAKKYGINGTSIIAKLPGINFPHSFPFDLLHLLINTFDNYTTFFGGPLFKDLDDGQEDYIISKDIWTGIGADTKKANATVPSQFGRAVPNVADERSHFTAEANLIWYTLYAPILLRGRFKRERYYKHLMRLISIILRLMKFKSTKIERDQLRLDIVVWYKQYEKIFYQYDKWRLPACLITVHAWLHLVDIIEKSGPLVYYWCWVMERFCGRLSRAITSHRFPYPSLNRRIVEHQSLQILRNTYDLQDRLPNYTLMHEPANVPTFTHRKYDGLTLLHPRSLHSFRDPGIGTLKYRVAACLARRYKTEARVIMPLLPPVFTQWAKISRDEGDVVFSNAGYPRGQAERGRRDATFMEYRHQVDLYAHIRRRKPKLVWKQAFAQLERVIVVEVPANPRLNFKRARTFILLDIHHCKTKKDKYGIYEYSDMGRHEVIDANLLRAVVGRIFDRGSWAIVRRGDGLLRTDFSAEEEDY